MLQLLTSSVAWIEVNRVSVRRFGSPPTPLYIDGLEGNALLCHRYAVFGVVSG